MNKSTLDNAQAPTPCLDDLHASKLIRERELVLNPKHPERPSLLGFSASTLWRRVKDGTFPAPVRPSPRITAWVLGDIRKWQAKLADECAERSPETNQ